MFFKVKVSERIELVKYRKKIFPDNLLILRKFSIFVANIQIFEQYSNIKMDF